MNRRKKVLLYLFICWLDIKSVPGKIKRIVWNKSILLWWNRLWIRKNEFDSSLDMDIEAMRGMNEEKEKRYLDNLVRRRSIAHKRDED
jgi:hypothetical protein